MISAEPLFECQWCPHIGKLGSHYWNVMKATAGTGTAETQQAKKPWVDLGGTAASDRFFRTFNHISFATGMQYDAVEGKFQLISIDLDWFHFSEFAHVVVKETYYIILLSELLSKKQMIPFCYPSCCQRNRWYHFVIRHFAKKNPSFACFLGHCLNNWDISVFTCRASAGRWTDMRTDTPAFHPTTLWYYFTACLNSEHLLDIVRAVHTSRYNYSSQPLQYSYSVWRYATFHYLTPYYVLHHPTLRGVTVVWNAQTKTDT